VAEARERSLLVNRIQLLVVAVGDEQTSRVGADVDAAEPHAQVPEVRPGWKVSA